MSFSKRIATAIAGIGIVLGTLSGCIDGLDGRVQHVRLADQGGKTLTIGHPTWNSLSVALKLQTDIDHCPVLEDNAFARLNGRPVTLARGDVHIIPPQGDDGGWDCTPPSVSTDIPGDMPPPWTIEIGDDSQIVQATFGPGATNPFQMDPPASTTLGSAYAPLVLPIERTPGDPTGASAMGRFTASDGSALLEVGDITPDSVKFSRVVNVGAPEGQVSAQIDVWFVPTEILFDCQNAACTIGNLCSQENPWCPVSMISATYALTVVCQPGGICG